MPFGPNGTRWENQIPVQESVPGVSPFPPIADYGFLSDGEVSALVAPSGNVEWMCVPRFDSPSVFGSILDRSAGNFRIGPADINVPASRRYIPGTMVLETSWGTPDGWLLIKDVLLIGPWHHERDRSHTHRRAPTDYDADHVLLRLVRCVHGEVQLTLDCKPVFDYGRVQAGWEYTGDGHALAYEAGADLIDMDRKNRALEGVLAVQVHVGPAMKIQSPTHKECQLHKYPCGYGN